VAAAAPPCRSRGAALHSYACVTGARRAAAHVRTPYLAELSCDAPGAGTMPVNTLNGLQGSPPFCAAFNLVRGGRPTGQRAFSPTGRRLRARGAAVRHARRSASPHRLCRLPCRGGAATQAS